MEFFHKIVKRLLLHPTPLLYGENPQQQAAFYVDADQADDPLGYDKFVPVEGTEMSFCGVAGWDRGIEALTGIRAMFQLNFGESPDATVVSKHGVPAGAAVGEDQIRTLRNAWFGDSLSAFGGVVITTVPFDFQMAAELLYDDPNADPRAGRHIIDIVAAPSFTSEAIELFHRKEGKCRLLVNPELGKLGIQHLNTQPVYRPVRGGMLVQTPPPLINLADPHLTYLGDLTEQQRRDLALAIAVCQRTISNTITMARDGFVVSNIGGSTSRVYPCQIPGQRRIIHNHLPTLMGSVVVSDSFFPFPDGPEALCAEKVAVVFCTSTPNTKRDDEIFELFRRNGVTVVHGSDKEFRMFYGH